jgi:hypothetical protein
LSFISIPGFSVKYFQAPFLPLLFSKKPVKQPLTDFTEKFIIQEKSNYKKENVHMTYTVGQMAKMLGLAGSTLRYYDKEGLLPFVERSSGGIRMFREKDYEWLQIIECLKKAGMSIKDIKKYNCRFGRIPQR